VLDGEPIGGLSTFHVEIVKVNGADPPAAAHPLEANRGDRDETWEFVVEARTGDGARAPFDGLVRLSVRPGAVMRVEGEGAEGRNILVRGGRASGVATVTAIYGPARLWVEDLGYLPAEPGEEPACSNGVNDDGDEDVLVDFPADPGCAFADDNTEEGGTFAAGVSAPVQYALPRVADIQGYGATTPYPYEGMQVNTADPQRVIVTRVASDGFYVTDLTGQDQGYNHLFAFNFNTPFGMRVCDRVDYLSGTVTEFFGFTELSFPSYQLDYVFEGEDCEVPEPAVLDAMTIVNPLEMERVESGLVRIEGYHIASHFGSKPAVKNVFLADQSSCDLNGDGQVDFESDLEGSCSKACSGDPECAEWTAYSARGNYKVSKGSSMIQINTGTVGGFDPASHKGETLTAVTGTLRNFSGGTLNWTIETRCSDDLACPGAGCVKAPVSSKKACVRLRSLNDNDAETQ
jgi:hypothetical protein